MNKINQVLIEGTVSKKVIFPADKHCKLIIPIQADCFYKDSDGKKIKEIVNVDVEYYGVLSDYKLRRLEVGKTVRVVGRLTERLIDDKPKIEIIAEFIDFRLMADDFIQFDSNNKEE